MNNLQFQNDLERLLAVLPNKIKEKVTYSQMEDVIEIVMDIGRPAEIRHSCGRIDKLETGNITQEDILETTSAS